MLTTAAVFGGFEGESTGVGQDRPGVMTPSGPSDEAPEGPASLQILVGAKSPIALEDAIREGFRRNVGDALCRPGFRGEVLFVFVPELTPPGPYLARLVLRMLAELNGRHLRCIQGAEVQVSFQYGR